MQLRVKPQHCNVFTTRNKNPEISGKESGKKCLVTDAAAAITYIIMFLHRCGGGVTVHTIAVSISEQRFFLLVFSFRRNIY